MKLIITILLTSVTITLAHAFDLPEIILYERGMPRNESFAEEFCWVGDQNGDGYDDLLVSHRGTNRVELFHGGEEMDGEPDFEFTTDEEFMALGQYMRFIGNLIPDREPFIAVSKLYRNVAVPPVIAYQQLFESGEEVDNEPDYLYSGGYEWGSSVPVSAHRSRPLDFNGDGYDDLVAMHYDDGIVLLTVKYGSADFDTIPDWEVEAGIGLPLTRISTGYDINADGYDDIFLSSEPDFNRPTYEIFLGGEEPDEEPVFSIPYDYFDGLILKYGFSLLPDINGDGYDDWGLHFNDDGWDWDGYYIFFGGEDPDMEPDILLQGNSPTAGHNKGDICGGDFNNDGYGDIVTGSSLANYSQGEVRYFFGRPDLPEEMESDILINMERDYGQEYGGCSRLVGAAGDYNGDGADDVVSAVNGDAGRFLILAGSDEWQVNSVDDELPTDHILLLDAYPNPFNDTVKLSFDVPISGEVKLSIYDIHGQLLEELTHKTFKQGVHTISWNANHYPTGIYFSVLEYTTRHTTDINIEKLIMLR